MIEPQILTYIMQKINFYYIINQEKVKALVRKCGIALSGP